MIGCACTFFNFNAIAAADASGLDNAAKQAAPPANLFLKTLPDFADLVARLAGSRDFEQSLPGAQPLSERQGLERDPAGRDVFPDASRRDAEFLECLQIH